MNIIKVSTSLDPDQDRRFVVPYLGLNCLQRLSVDDSKRPSNTEQFKRLLYCGMRLE